MQEKFLEDQRQRTISLKVATKAEVVVAFLWEGGGEVSFLARRGAVLGDSV